VRLDIYNETKAIKEGMAREKIPIDLKKLERQMQFPPEIDMAPQDKQYPDPGYGLMVNPFPATKKKKKGKKGKK